MNRLEQLILEAAWLAFRCLRWPARMAVNVVGHIQRRLDEEQEGQ